MQRFTRQACDCRYHLERFSRAHNFSWNTTNIKIKWYGTITLISIIIIIFIIVIMTIII